MAIEISTTRPKRLLSKILESLNSDDVATWDSDSEGDLTLTDERFRMKAWFRPRCEEGALVFRMVPREDEVISKSVYAEFHARLVSFLLTNFDDEFKDVRATALPSLGDVIGTKSDEEVRG